MFTGSFLILLKLQIKEKISRSEATFFCCLAEPDYKYMYGRCAFFFFSCDVGGFAGGESHDFCVQNTTEKMWRGCRQRWGKTDNYHIKMGGEERGRIQNKCNLPRSPSPKQPSLFSFFSVFWQCTVSMLHLVLSDTRRAQRRVEMETDRWKDGARLCCKVNSEIVIGKGSTQWYSQKKVTGTWAELMTFAAAAGLPFFSTAALPCGETVQ